MEMSGNFIPMALLFRLTKRRPRRRGQQLEQDSTRSTPSAKAARKLKKIRPFAIRVPKRLDFIGINFFIHEVREKTRISCGFS
jgi:hypothetical protein